ncbi:MAG: DEAD/DEAH box helicase [Candidatus Woesearchaeota archaeon]
MPQIRFTLREYQKNIVETAKNKNTLVVLPTGLGKTKIAIALAIERLNKFPESQILMCSPTRPLSNQIKNEFLDSTSIDESKIILLTGMISPKKRTDLYKKSKIIVATPQTIAKDLENKRINLENFSLLVLDEAHRSRMKYANTIVTQSYMKQSQFPRILALTASPGSTKEKINEIKENLFIEAIELRDEESKDVKQYIQKKNIELIEVELPKEFLEIHALLSEVYKKRLKQLKEFGLTKPLSIINKRDLLDFQNYLFSEAKSGNRASYYGVSLTAAAIKLSHALELLETQGLSSFSKFLKKLETETSKASKNINQEPQTKKAKQLLEKLQEKDLDHPKLTKLAEIIKTELKNNINSKIIIFANFRDTVKNIVKELDKIPEASPVELIGQKEGITQKKQLETIKQFEEGKYNIIVGTQITEEGLDLKGGLSIAIFFDQAASAIRKIQRTGRVGRLEAGKIIHLITKGTRDQGYFWKSHKDVKKMKNIISRMKTKLDKQTTL